MLLNCPSCNTSYLVNSADFQPNGRIVKCTYCSNQWFQKASFSDDDQNFLKKEIKQTAKKDNYEKKLPSRYIETPKTSIRNSFLVIFLLIFLIFSYFSIKNFDGGFLHLIKFYCNEIFLFINLIIENLANNIHNLFN